MQKCWKRIFFKWQICWLVLFLYSASVIPMEDLSSPKTRSVYRGSPLSHALGGDDNYYIAGDTDYGNGSMWINGYVNAANLKPIENYQGYNAVSKGFTLGVNSVDCDCSEDILGFGLGFAHTDTSAHAGANLNTKSNTYYGLAYGTHNWYCHNFVDWFVYGSYAHNYAESAIFNNVSNGRISSAYYSESFAGRLTRGKSFYFLDSYNFTPLTYVQYVYLHQPTFVQNRNATQVQLVNPSKNFVTLGLGAKFNFPTDAWRCVGMREVRAAVSYDVMSSKNVTNANLIVADSRINVIGTSSRLAWLLGAGFTYCFAERFDVLLNYDFELRSGFTSNTGLVKFRYTF